MNHDWRKAIADGETSRAERRAWLKCLDECLWVLEEAKSLEEARRGLVAMVDEAMQPGKESKS